MKFLFIFKLIIISSFTFFYFHSFTQKKPELLIFDSTKVCNGYILWQDLESSAHLIDRNCKLLYNFPGNLCAFFNNKKVMVSSVVGNLIAFNRNFDELWNVNLNKSIHHEITITPENNILLLSSENIMVNNNDIRFDIILCFDSNGKRLYKWSTYEQRRYLMSFMMKHPEIYHYKDKKNKKKSDPDSVFLSIASRLKKAGSIPAEFFHMNAIQILPANESEKKDTAFREGNILLGFTSTNESLSSFIAIVDPINYKILWYYVQKNCCALHTPTMLKNGNILMYVNSNGLENGCSLVDEINPVKKKVVWSFTENFPKDTLRSGRGSCQRLPNGNTLISNASGYIYEVTPQKEIVWQYFTDNRYPVYRASLYSKEMIDWLINED